MSSHGSDVARVGRVRAGRAQVVVPYSLKIGGQVSLAVYDEQGRQVRTLLSGEKQKAGEQHAVWDGLDWAGKPAPAGTYQWRLLQTQGLKARYLMQLGISYNDGAWPCNNVGPHDIACNGAEAVIGGSGEFCPAIAALRLKDGQRLGWGRVNGRVGDVAVAGNRIFHFGAPGQIVATTIEPFDREHTASRVLVAPVRRIRMGPAAADADAERWEQAGLELYAGAGIWLGRRRRAERRHGARQEEDGLVHRRDRGGNQGRPEDGDGSS